MANRDVLVMTVASFFASIAAFIVQMGFWFGGAFDSRDNNNGPAFIVVILVSAAVRMLASRLEDAVLSLGKGVRPDEILQPLHPPLQ